MSAQAQILITGGTGKTGGRVIKRLEEANVPYRLGTRSADIPFDWYNDATWAAALAGMKRVYAVFYPDVAMKGAPEIIEKFAQAAKEAGVQHMVLLSGRGEQRAEESEQRVIDSGLDWTIVRCAFFMQNFSEGFLIESIIHGELVMPTNPDVAEPFIDAEDIADTVFAALTHPEEHRGKLYELTGPELITFEEAAARIAKATGKDITYHTVTYDEYEAGMRAAGVPEEMIETLLDVFKQTLDGRNQHLTDGVQQALGRKASSFDAYVEQTAAAGVWQ